MCLVRLVCLNDGVYVVLGVHCVHGIQTGCDVSS